MRLRFARSSRRHRIGREHVMHVINSVDPEVAVNDRGEQEYLLIGADDRGVTLEVAAVVEGDLLLVLHVMPQQYRRT